MPIIDGKEWRLVPVEPTLEMGWAYLNAAEGADPLTKWVFSHPGYRAAIAAAPTPPAATAAPSDDPIKPEEVPAAMVEDLRSAIEGECDGLDVTEHQARMILGLLLTEHPDWERHGGAQPAASAEPSEQDLAILFSMWGWQTADGREFRFEHFKEIAHHLIGRYGAPVAAQASAVVNQQLTTEQAPAANGDAPSSEQRYAIKEGERIASTDAYFHARPYTIVSNASNPRKMFEAGFDRGWDAAMQCTTAAGSPLREGGKHGDF